MAIRLPFRQPRTEPDDLAYCREIFRSYSRTYYLSAQLFPPDVRRHVWALYAFVRLPDEYVDNPQGDPAADLAAFRSRYEEAWRTGGSADRVLRAFTFTASRFGIEKAWTDAFLDAMQSDLSVARYETFEDLRRYVYGSAEVVGLMMARVLGVPPEGLRAARELGLAMQLTNFLRDVGEDWEQRGRIYVPTEDLERFGLREADWHAGVDPERFAALMRFEADRNRRLYAEAHAGLRYIPRQSRLAVAMASLGYQQTLQAITPDPMVVWRRRLSRRRVAYLPILLRAWNAAYIQ